MRAYASCDHLASSANNAMAKNEMLSIRQKRGKVVEVYDGRKWPVVRCGSVYVTSEDTTQRVTQTVVTATSVAEKKRRANKYTVAVGTSHGHVQAFLEDADSVLAALDQCQAEEKCLMLIKKPKDAAKKMLKSHSLSNLSVSDPQLYRQFNGLHMSQLHPGPPSITHKGKRSSDEQSVTSNDTDRSEPRRRYVSAKGKENLKQQHHQQQHNRRSLPQTNKSPSYYSDSSSSVASEFSYVSRRDRDRDRESHRRADLRYSSIPEDAREINNNAGKNHGGASMYHSCQDLSATAQTNGAPRQDWNRGQSQRHSGQIASDQMYGSRGQQGCDTAQNVHDPGDMEDTVRSRSLGNLSTGLTFSVVGQRKADSMLDLSTVSASTSASQDPPRSHAPARHWRSEGGPYPEHTRSPEGSARTPRNGIPDHSRTPRRSSGEDDVFSPPAPHQQPNGYYNGMNNQHHHNYKRNSNNAQHGESAQHGTQRQYHNGYAYNSGSSNTSREQTPQGDAPPKPKRSLPHVPLNETSERIKRFTEIMRSRVSVCSSSAGRSTSNSTLSQTPTTPHTPPSRQASFTDNGSDCEISNLMEARTKESPAHKPNSEGRSGGRGPHPQHHYQEYVKGQEEDGRERRGRPHHQSARHPSSAQETPQPYGDHASESGQTPFTSHSHSSTMDSGYTTNTEGDGDSTANSSHHHLSPPHHYPPHYNHHPHQHQHQPNNHHNSHNTSGASPHPAHTPRNLSLAAARKFNSMQNVSSGYIHQSHAYPPGPPVHPAEHGIGRNQAPPHPKGPPPVRGQHPSDPHGEHQRRSWDLAVNFKSLDYTPGVENGQRDNRSQGHEDLVVKPQAVSMNRNINHRQEPGSPRRTESQKRPERKGYGQGRQGIFKDTRNVDNAPPPAVTSNTLPGHWKYNSNVPNNEQDGNTNNNGNIRNSKIAPQTLPKPIDTSTTPAPTLFQLSHSFDLCSTKLYLPADLCMGRLVTVTSIQVVLPCDSGSPPVLSPQGRCARLGGPGSAFRPVRMGSGGGGQVTMEMVGVGTADPQCQQLCVLGDVRPGDVIVEVNGRQCVGMDVGGQQRLLDGTLGEVTLTLARKKEEKMDNRVQQLENSLQKLQMEVQRMNEELTKKDARIRELSTMLPWKCEEESSNSKVSLGQDEGAFVIGDNEFVV